MTRSVLVNAIIIAYKIRSGYRKGTISWKHNNPGKLTSYAEKKNSIYGMVAFDTPQEGLKALRNKIYSSIRKNDSFYQLAEDTRFAKLMISFIRNRPDITIHSHLAYLIDD